MAKAKKSDAKKMDATPENKTKLKGALMELKSQKDAAITEGDKKKLKAVRYKIKKANRVLCNMADELARIKAAEAAAAKAAEG